MISRPDGQPESRPDGEFDAEPGTGRSDATRDQGRVGQGGAGASSNGFRVTLAGTSADALLGPCTVEGVGDGDEVRIDGVPATDRLHVVDPERSVLMAGEGESQRVLILPGRVGAPRDRGIECREIVIAGWRVEVEIEPAARAALRARARRGRSEGTASGPTEVRAMIPGIVLAISVTPGDTVVAGQQLVVVEAMKMQNELRAPRGGSIEQVAVAPGTRLEVGDLLLVIA